MSATIPENMLLSDLLKSTGYDCPDSLKEKTFDESTSGGSEVVLENNKEATIDVSSYTAPVEITPSEGKDAMKKATVTLSNIPSGGSATAYAWAYEYEEKTEYDYFAFGSAPANTDGWKQLLISADAGSGNYFQVAGWATAWGGWTYTKVSDTEFTLSRDGKTVTYTRAVAKDFTLWS